LGDKVTVRHWITCAWAVFRKDVQVELRTRLALGAVLLFAVTTLIAVSAALSSAKVHSEVKAALLWIVLLFAALSGLARVFVREEEAGTAPLLRLYAPATAVYAGKWLFNIALLFAVEAVSVPLFLIVLPPDVVNFGLLFGVLILGGVGLSGAATFIAALIAQASSGKSALFFIVAFPVLLPLLLIAVQGTIGSFSSLTFDQTRSRSDLGLLASYGLVMTTTSFLLFEYIWHD
jgi:heme exporter protein B